MGTAGSGERCDRPPVFGGGVAVGLRRRLEKLEEGVTPLDLPDWPIEDQLEDVLEALRIHRIAGSAQLATDREIRLMAMACSGEEITGFVGIEDLPEGVCEYFERMDPAEQPAREMWLHASWQALKEQREYWRHWFSEEQVRARREESERRDRELLERNRGEGAR